MADQNLITVEGGETIALPKGYSPMVWELPGGSQRGVRPSSKLHIATGDQGDRPYRALCGARFPDRGKRDLPHFAEGICARCTTSLAKRVKASAAAS